MKLFLDTSVLLAACGSATGASREIFNRYIASDWALLTTPYVIEETVHNLGGLPADARIQWEHLRPALQLREDVLTLDRISLFGPGKDRPILFSALAFADILLTLDVADFGSFMGRPFYGLVVRRPGAFLEAQRADGTLR